MEEADEDDHDTPGGVYTDLQGKRISLTAEAAEWPRKQHGAVARITKMPYLTIL